MLSEKAYPNLVPLRDNAENTMQLILNASSNIASSIIPLIAVGAGANFHACVLAKRHRSVVDKVLR